MLSKGKIPPELCFASPSKNSFGHREWELRNVVGFHRNLGSASVPTRRARSQRVAGRFHQSAPEFRQLVPFQKQPPSFRNGEKALITIPSGVNFAVVRQLVDPPPRHSQKSRNVPGTKDEHFLRPGSLVRPKFELRIQYAKAARGSDDVQPVAVTSLPLDPLFH